MAASLNPVTMGGQVNGAVGEDGEWVGRPVLAVPLSNG